ncbi:MAG: cadherin repeat domain-containing protein, partial [Victivallales bacterium]
GDILVQQAHDNVVSNNIIYTSSQNIPVTNPFGTASSYNNTFDYNLYYTPGGADNAIWNWKNKDYENFAAFKTASGQDSHSIFADPLFLDLALFDVHLQDASPAIDSGNTAYVSATGEKDLFDNVRLSGAAVDIGASESGDGTQLTAENQSPKITASAWITPVSPFASVPATVDVRATDPDNGPSSLNYSWSKVSGTGTVIFNISGYSAVSARSVTFSAAGNYLLSVSATDGEAITTTSLYVTVQAASASTPGQVTSWILPGTTTTLLKPKFKWAAASNAGRYLLKVDDLTTGQAGIIRRTVTTTAFTATTALKSGHQYQVVVTAQSSNGGISGIPSPALVFTVQPNTALSIPAPNPLTPTGTIDDAWPWCEWTSVKNADYYKLIITDLTTGMVAGTMQVTATGTNFNKGLTPNHSYSWKVCAGRNDGTLGEWSSALTFKESANAR